MTDKIRPWCCVEPRCNPTVNFHQLKDVKQAEPGKSIFCWGFLPKPVTFSYDGEQHCNDMSFCCYTALKGMIRFQMNKDDFELLTTGTARFLEKLAECGMGGEEMKKLNGPLKIAVPCDGTPEWDICDASGRMVATTHREGVAEVLVEAYNDHHHPTPGHDVEDFYKDVVWENDHERIIYEDGYLWEVKNSHGKWQEQHYLFSGGKFHDHWWRLTPEQLATIQKHNKWKGRR